MHAPVCDVEGCLSLIPRGPDSLMNNLSIAPHQILWSPKVMKSFLLVPLLVPISFAFITPYTTPTRAFVLQLQLSETSSRRSFIVREGTLGLSILIPWVSQTKSVMAKEDAPPATRENIKKAFDDLRYELNGSEGGVARMQRAIDSEDWSSLMEVTKTYDQVLRKGKVGRVKSFLSEKEKSILTLSANAITFDLIGINRNARPGQENASEANRYLDELRTDLQLIIDKERLVAYID